MWSDIDARWSEIFSTSINLLRVGLSAVESSNYLQLIPLKWKFIQRKLNQLLSLKLWHLLEYAKLTEMVKQSDHTFANALNYIRLSIVDGNTNKVLKVKFIDQPEENYLDTLHIWKCANSIDKSSTAWKVSVFGVILVRIFPLSDWIRRGTENLSVFSPNAGKSGPE